MRSLASFETFEKYSFGKLKSQRKMLLVVSSSESSKNGDRPLKTKQTYFMKTGELSKKMGSDSVNSKKMVWMDGWMIFTLHHLKNSVSVL